MSFYAVTCFIVLVPLVLPLGYARDARIKEPPSYEAKIVPENFKDARMTLGYDNFRRLPPSPINHPKKYAWDQDPPQVKLNFGFGK